MGGLSIWHWLIFLAVALLLFGGSGKISSIMGDVAKGIKSFKKGMSEDDETVKKDEPPKALETAGKPAEQRPGQPTVDANKAGWSSKA
jgi:sec-independent protein translocase protein TatA